MKKSIMLWVVAALLAVPGGVSAGGGGGGGAGGGIAAAEFERKIEDLNRELDKLREQMASLKEQAMQAAGKKEMQQEFLGVRGDIAGVRGDLSSLKGKTDAGFTKLDERAEKWDLASRFELFGDFRFRADAVSAAVIENWAAPDLARGIAWFVDPTSMAPGNNSAVANAGSTGVSYGTVGLLMGFGMTQAQAQAQMNMLLYGNAAGSGSQLSAIQRVQNLVEFMKGFTPAQRTSLFQALGFGVRQPSDDDNDTIYTTRFRLNMRVKATEDVEFKSRLAMYKSWGMESNPINSASGYDFYDGPFKLSAVSMDGNRSRVPEDNILRVDRAYINWNNIGGAPVWFSVGRRPTTGGVPGQLKSGADDREATPTAFMDYAFDGATLGYAHTTLFGMDWPGKIRLCYGRGFEAGVNVDGTGLDDVDFAGVSWDVYNKGNRFLTVQSFGAFNMMNVPDGVVFNNPLEQAFLADGTFSSNLYDRSRYANGILDTENLGNIYHTTGVYMDKVDKLNYFVGLGWSRTDPKSRDEMGVGLLSSWWDRDYQKKKDGYSVYTGVRYDMDHLGLKLGAEYNYGSKNWIAFTPGHDDVYASKLAVRGHAAEVYLIWKIPAGEAISKYGNAYMRAGYQRHWYNYTGSGFWLGEPQKISDLKNDPLNAQFYSPVEYLDQLYVSFDVAF